MWCFVSETWHIGKPMTTKRGDFAVGFIGDKVIVAGGLGTVVFLYSAVTLQLPRSGLCKEKKFHKSEFTMKAGGWVQVSL